MGLTITARARRDLLMLSVFFLAIFLGARAEAAPDPATNLHINKAIIDLQDSKDQDSKAGDYSSSSPRKSSSDYIPWSMEGEVSKYLEVDWKGLKVPVQMPDSMHSQAKFTSNPSAGLILDVKNPSNTNWQITHFQFLDPPQQSHLLRKKHSKNRGLQDGDFKISG